MYTYSPDSAATELISYSNNVCVFRPQSTALCITIVLLFEVMLTHLSGCFSEREIESNHFQMNFGG
jgi:hypothetical protein